MTSYQIPDYDSFTDSHGKIFRVSVYEWMTMELQEKIDDGSVTITDDDSLIKYLKN